MGKKTFLQSALKTSYLKRERNAIAYFCFIVAKADDTQLRARKDTKMLKLQKMKDEPGSELVATTR